MFRSTFIKFGMMVFAATMGLASLDAHAVTIPVSDTVVVDGAPVNFSFITNDGVEETYDVEFMTDTSAASIGGSAGAFTFALTALPSFPSSSNIEFRDISLTDGNLVSYSVTTNPDLPIVSSSLLFSADVSGSTSNIWTLSFLIFDSSASNVMDFVTGQLSAASVLHTPLPAALPLFATALAGMG